MRQAVLEGIAEAFHHAHHQLRGLQRLDLGADLDQVAKVPALDELHDQIVRLAVGADVVDGHDVGMPQGKPQFALAEEHGRPAPSCRCSVSAGPSRRRSRPSGDARRGTRGRTCRPPRHTALCRGRRKSLTARLWPGVRAGSSSGTLRGGVAFSPPPRGPSGYLRTPRPPGTAVRSAIPDRVPVARVVQRLGAPCRVQAFRAVKLPIR